MSCLLWVSIICPSIPPLVPPLFVHTPVLLSLPLSLPLFLPPCPRSVFTFFSASVSIPPALTTCLRPPSVPQSLPHYRRLFLCLCHFPVCPCLLPSISSTFSPSHRSCLAPFLLFSLPTPLATSSLNKPTADIHLLPMFRLVFLLPGQLSVYDFFFQRHDATNGKTYEGWKRMKSCFSSWFQCDYFSFSCKFTLSIRRKLDVS